MKIAIDARMYGLENAGIGRYILHLVGELAKLDNKNEYIIFLRKKYFETLELPNNWKKIQVDFRHYSLKEQILFPKYFNTYKPDFVHFPHFNVPLSFKGKFIVTIHDLLMHKQTGKEATTLNPVFYRLKRIGYWKVFKHAVVDATTVIVPTMHVKSEVEKYYHIPTQKIVVTYEGISNIWTKEGKGNRVVDKYGLTGRYFIYTGNAYPHKNLRRAIEAVASLNQNGNQAQLVIVSARNVFTKRLEKTIHELQAEEYVRLLGFVPDEDLLYLYRNALAFLYPSLIEGFGLPGLEAMATGTLALVSDIPVFKEVYQTNAIYFNPYDFSSIEKALEDVCKMPESDRKKRILNGQKYATTFSWKKTAEETLDAYLSVFNS